MKKLILGSLCAAYSLHCFAAQSDFLVTPLIAGQVTLLATQTGSAVYQITNNTHQNFTNLGLAQMPAGVTPDVGPVSQFAQYCTNPFSLAPGASCLLKVDLNTNQLTQGISKGPIVCYSQSNPIYCSQPYSMDQLHLSVQQNAIPQDCNSNYANFNYELLQNFDSGSAFDSGWGPVRNVPQLSPYNPNLTNCPTTGGVAWERARVIAAADFWVSQKLNYCHHYNPDYATPLNQRNAGGTSGGYCNPAVDLMPGSVYYGQEARWNYNGQGYQTANGWVNNNQMWYGMDCSNTTSFIYGFALGTNPTLGIPFDSKTSNQAGQYNKTGQNQDNLTPNQQVPADPTQVLNNPSEAGLLVCADGTTDPTPSSPSMCTGHGGYLSGIDSTGKFTKNITVAQVAQVLQPGDLLYIAGGGGAPDSQPNPDGSSSIVTHVIMWIGKQVGTGPNNINPSLIAPDDSPCADPSIWQPQTGDWVIADSHYQGYDYRKLTTCFYLNDLWGVRRVLN